VTIKDLIPASYPLSQNNFGVAFSLNHSPANPLKFERSIFSCSKELIEKCDRGGFWYRDNLDQTKLLPYALFGNGSTKLGSSFFTLPTFGSTRCTCISSAGYGCNSILSSSMF